MHLLNNAETQWMFYFFAVELLVLLNLHRFSLFHSHFWFHTNPSIWQVCLLLIGLIYYCCDYANSVLPALSLTFLAGAVLGQGFVFLAKIINKQYRTFIFCLPLLMLMLLATTLVWSMDSNVSYSYHGCMRWLGIWGNPNIAGLLAVTGVVLAVGCNVWHLQYNGVKKFGLIFLYLSAFYFLWHALLQSFSRGAWLGTSAGLAWLAGTSILSRKKWKIVKEEGKENNIKPMTSWILWLRNNELYLFIILTSIAVTGFWQLRQTDWHLARRVLSSVDTVDFSWRNRVTAWMVDLQIMAEHWYGAGWNQPEPLYKHFYLPPKLNESAAIQMNDYLLLGATLGIPALFCFGMYLRQSLVTSEVLSLCSGKNHSRKGESKSKPKTLNAIWLRTTCHAGAVVLIVGFWFDGGLFKLPTAATFWILLELGNVQDVEVGNELKREKIKA